MAFARDGNFTTDSWETCSIGAASALRSLGTPPPSAGLRSLGTPPPSAGYDLNSRPCSKASRPHSRSRSQAGSRCGTSNGRSGTSSGRPPSGAGLTGLSGSASLGCLKSLPLRADVLLSNTLFEELDDGITPDFLRHLTGKERLEEVETLEMQVDAVSGSQSVECLGELLPNLKQMRLTQSAICNIRDLGTSYAQLRVLWLCRSALQDLGGITAMPVLEELYISFNDVRDLSPLCMHDTLQVLDVEANLIEDLDEIVSLQTVRTLRELTLSSNPVSRSETYSRDAVLAALPQLEVLDDLLRGGNVSAGVKVLDLEDDDLDVDADPFAGLEDLIDPVTTSGSDREDDKNGAPQEDTESSAAVAELRKGLAQIRAEPPSPSGSPEKVQPGEPSELELIAENVKRARQAIPNIFSMHSMTGRPAMGKGKDGMRPSTSFCPDRRGLKTAWSNSGSSTTYRPGSSTSGVTSSAFTSSSAAYSAEDMDANGSDLTTGEGVLAGNALSAIRRRRKVEKEKGVDANSIRDMLRRCEATQQQSCLSEAELELRRRQFESKRPSTSDVRIRVLPSSHGRPADRPAGFPSSLPGAPGESWVSGGGKQKEKRPSSRCRLDYADGDFFKPTFSTEAGEALIID